ncbi:hypothetical protein PBRA_008468 [Plasmodiophora brassicae]|uniref:Uncharacterized protein n=1 Tax=Plasmodiophora brassicae TaxID=37360 RepID=A0A0G4J1K7_PLABS|nr:hypothetical protein PBRA_008468 [Plasmodiophora brassicae]
MGAPGSPTLSVANDKYGWGNVELTVYARNPSGLNGTASTGFTIQARSGGASSIDQCSYRCYLAKTYFASRQFGMQKQYLPTYYSASVRTATSSVPYSAFVSRFVGMKLIVRSALNGSTVTVDLYVDYTEGVNGGRRNALGNVLGTWQKVLTRIDANNWPTNSAFTPATYPCNNYSDQGAYPGYTANILTPGKTCMITLTSPENSAQQSEWKWFSIRNIGGVRPSTTSGTLRTVPKQSAKGSLTRKPTMRPPSPTSVRITGTAAGAGDVTSVIRSTITSTAQATSPSSSSRIAAVLTSSAPAAPLALPIGKAFKAYQFTVAARLGTATYSSAEINVDLPRDLANAMALSAGISAARFTGVHLNANADQSTITFYLLPTISPSNLTEMANVAFVLVSALATPTSSLYASLFLGRVTSTIDPSIRARSDLVNLQQCSPGVFAPADTDALHNTCLQPSSSTTPTTRWTSPASNRVPGPGTPRPAGLLASFLTAWTPLEMLLSLAGVALVALVTITCAGVVYCRRRRRRLPGNSSAAQAHMAVHPSSMALPIQTLTSAPQMYFQPQLSTMSMYPTGQTYVAPTLATTSSVGGPAVMPTMAAHRLDARQRRWRAMATAEHDNTYMSSSTDDGDTLPTAPLPAIPPHRSMDRVAE